MTPVEINSSCLALPVAELEFNDYGVQPEPSNDLKATEKKVSSSLMNFFASQIQPTCDDPNCRLLEFIIPTEFVDVFAQGGCDKKRGEREELQAQITVKTVQ